LILAGRKRRFIFPFQFEQARLFARSVQLEREVSGRNGFVAVGLHVALRHGVGIAVTIAQKIPGKGIEFRRR
jgi:hypothetical protein